MDQLQLFKNIPCHYTYWSNSPVQVTLPQPVTINQFNPLGFSGNYTVTDLMPEALHVAYTLYLHILYDS